MDSNWKCVVTIQEQSTPLDLNKLASEFNLQIIRTYETGGHGKGAIDGVSSFGVKNVLPKDIVTPNILFNKISK